MSLRSADKTGSEKIDTIIDDICRSKAERSRIITTAAPVKYEEVKDIFIVGETFVNKIGSDGFYDYYLCVMGENKIWSLLLR